MAEEDDLLTTEIKQKLKNNTYKIRAYSKIKDLLYTDKNLLNVLDLYLANIRDEEFRNFVTLGTGVNVPFPEGWSRKLGLNLVEQIPLAYKLQFVQNLIWKWSSDRDFDRPFPGMLNKRVDLYFVLDSETDEILGFFNFKEEEYKMTGFAWMGIRGTHEQKQAVGHLLIKFWHEIYAKLLYDYGIRWVNAIAWTKKNQEYIQHFNKQDKRNKLKSGFHETGITERMRVDGNVKIAIRYQYDLWKKFGNKEIT
jgi:hypothetical protein